MSRIIVGSYMIRCPLGGMMSYTAQWLVGLQDLGHDVYLVEKSGYPRSCYDPEADAMTDDCTYGTRAVSALFAQLDMGARWSFVDASGVYHGMSRETVTSLFRSADAFVDLGTHGTWLDEADGLPRVLVDGEPSFTQMKMVKRQAAGEVLPVYDYYYTVGQNIGTAASTAPTAGRAWRHIYYPVVTRLFASADTPDHDARFTTVMNWQTHEPLEFEGRIYRQKDVEFARFMALPSLTRQPLEVAVAGRAVPTAALAAAGWQVRDAHAVTRSFDSFRRYVATSKGEFSVCKHVFVATTSGWFGDRNAAYLASGRPVVLQDTGFSAHLPCGEGLFAVTSADEAVDALERAARDYRRHSRAALAVAHEHLDAPKVLGPFLRDIGLPVRGRGRVRP